MSKHEFALGVLVGIAGTALYGAYKEFEQQKIQEYLENKLDEDTDDCPDECDSGECYMCDPEGLGEAKNISEEEFNKMARFPDKKEVAKKIDIAIEDEPVKAEKNVVKTEKTTTQSKPIIKKEDKKTTDKKIVEETKKNVE